MKKWSSSRLWNAARAAVVAAAALWTASPAVAAIRDNNTHVDRGVLYTNYSFLTADGGTAPYTFTASGMPAGLTLNANGTVSGVTCGSNGNFSLNITATDALGATQTATNQVLIVNAAPAGGCSLSFSSGSTVPAATVGLPYSHSFTATGGSAPYSFSRASGSLPPGLSLSTSGALTGTPTTAGSYSFTVLVTDSTSSNTGSSTFTMTVNAGGGATLTLAPASLPGATGGAAYSQTVSASGGSAPYSFSVHSGSLPTGLALNSATGVLSGTPTAVGSFSVTLRALDSLGSSGTQAYTLVVGAPSITVTPATLPGASVGSAYSQQLCASGGLGATSWSVTAGSLPAGLSLSSVGLLSGTPTTPGSHAFTVTATDAQSYTGSRAYTLTVAASIALTPASLPAATGGQPYSQTLSAAGGSAPYSYAVTAGSLPAGLALSSAGVLSGTPTAAGSFSVTVTATDAGGATGTRAYTLSVAAPSISVSPATLPAPTAGSAYSATLTASGGSAPHVFSVGSGALPAGLSLSAGGLISGTPSAAGNASFTVVATDAQGFTGSRSYSLDTAAGLAVTPTYLADATAGAAFNQVFIASGGTPGYGFTLISGSLPPGLSLSFVGALSGTPLSAGTFTFTIEVTDSAGGVLHLPLSLIVNAPAISLMPATLPDGVAGAGYAQVLGASGGSAAYSFAVTAGALPAGLTLSSDGSLTGTPAANGSYSFTLSATDALGFSGSRSYSIAIGNALSTALAQPTVALTTRVAGSATPVTASGGSAPYSFAVSPALPAGLSFNAGNGQLTGSMGSAHTGSYSVTVTDALGAQSSKSFTLAVSAPTIGISPATLAEVSAGSSMSVAITAAGGAGPYSFSASGLPQGLSLSSAGVLSGSATSAGSHAFTVTATDANGNSGTRSYTLGVRTALSLGAAQPAVNATVGVAQRLTPVTASGGQAPYTFAIAPALPAGLSFNTSTGELTGVATAVLPATPFTITVTDAAGASASRAVTLRIDAPVLTIQPGTLPAYTQGTARDTTLAASGGSAPYRFSLASGQLPAGLALDASGALSGAPTEAGSFAVTVTAVDALGFSVTQPYTLTVSNALQTTQRQARVRLDSGQGGRVRPVEASGGTAPFAFSIAPALPAGLTLDPATGEISGTPAATLAPTAFEITVTDAAGAVRRQSFTLAITLPVAIVITPDTLRVPHAGRSVEAVFIASGGRAPYAFSAVGLPEGLTLSTDGRLGGRARRAGAFDVSITATDADGEQGMRVVSVTVGERADPATDPGVIATQSSQQAAMQRMAGAQVDNVLARLDTVRDCLSDGRRVQLAVPSGPGDRQAEVLGQLPSSADSRADARSDSRADEPRCQPHATWVGGAIAYGRRDGDGYRFTSPGLSAGIDWRLGAHAVGGLAVGLGEDRITLAAAHGRQQGRQASLSGYGSWKLAAALHLDGVAGWGRTQFDSQRSPMGETFSLHGERRGTQVFGALRLSGSAHWGALRVLPYVGVQAAQVTLDRYTESGDELAALAYERSRFDTRAWRGGLTLSQRLAWAGLQLEPMLRLEHTRNIARTVEQGLAYADDPATRYSLLTQPFDRQASSATLGLGYDLSRGRALSLQAGWQWSGSTLSQRRIALNARFPM